MTMLDYFSRWNLYDRTASFCIWRVYSIGLSIMKVYIHRVPFALPYIISNRDGWSATIFQIMFELLPLFLSFPLKPSYTQWKLGGMTFTPGDGQVSLMNLFPSMPLGSREQTLSFKGAAVRPSYLLPEPLFRGPASCSVSWGDRGDPGPRLSSLLVLLWCPYARPLFHLVICKPPQALQASTRKEKVLQRGPGDKHTAPVRPVAISCLLRVLRDAAWMFPYPRWTSCDCLMLSGPLGMDWYRGHSWRASVLVRCAFSVIKRNDFPKPRILCIDTWALLFNFFLSI